MSVFNDELEIIRRFLRDPDGNIWSDYDIVTFWNDAQQEVFSKINYQEKVHTYKYPPEWTWAYMWDWEYDYCDGDIYRCLNQWQARDATNCYPWEAGYWLDNSDVPDDGTRFIHPWESEYCSPADIVPLPLHSSWHQMKFCAYDEEELRGIDIKSLASSDPYYKTTTGKAEWYWMPDENTFVMYRRPSSVTWDDTNLFRSPLDTFDDAGQINTWHDDHYDETDKGFITDLVETDGQVFMVFEAIPDDVSENPVDWFNDEFDYPFYLQKYVRYGALERCYGSDTDGFIPSLRDYWALRKEIGIKAIKKFKALRKTDRDYRMGGGRSGRTRPTLKLPSGYPVTYP